MGEQLQKQAAPESEDEKLAFDYHPAWGLIGIILGVLVILAAGFYEQRTLNHQPFAQTLYGFNQAPQWVEPLTIHSRRLPRSEFTSVYDAVEEFRNNAQGQTRQDIDTFIEATGLMDTERILSVPFTQEQLQPALASGRLPTPGQPELLAGANARLDTFKIDGQTFLVVGRLRKAGSPFHFTYLIPAHSAWLPLFEEHPATETGWLDTNGRTTLRQQEMPPSREFIADLESPTLPADPRITAATISGLMLVALFGAMAHLSLFRVIMPLRCGPLRPAIRVLLTRPRLVIAMHIFLFGGMFTMMLLAARMPVPNIWITNLIRHTFSEGGLQYVAEAYASGNIPRAAWATFLNNYLLQTVVLTFGISLIIPGIGILKTLLSFTMVGFGMSPLWAGMATTFSFHSITMTLELQAYIFACIFVLHFWTHLALVLIKGQFLKRLKEATLALLSGLLLTAIMLALAATYEAITLIAAAH